MSFISDFVSEENRASFLFLNGKEERANELRSILFNEIGTAAFHIATFMENSSVLHSEIIAHRIGLVPIIVSKLPSDFPTERKVISCVLDVSATNEIRNVYSTDFSSSVIKPKEAFFKCQLTSLLPGERIFCVAEINFDYRPVHAKYGPITKVSFKEDSKTKKGFLFRAEVSGVIPVNDVVHMAITKLLAKHGKEILNKEKDESEKIIQGVLDRREEERERRALKKKRAEDRVAREKFMADNPNAKIEFVEEEEED